MQYNPVLRDMPLRPRESIPHGKDLFRGHLHVYQMSIFSVLAIKSGPVLLVSEWGVARRWWVVPQVRIGGPNKPKNAACIRQMG